MLEFQIILVYNISIGPNKMKVGGVPCVTEVT